MANPNIPNLCGASPELNEALTKITDLENEITSKIDAAASDAAAAFDSALTDVKAGLDGLALDLPEAPNVNFQSELTGLINDIDRTTLEGIAAFNNKLAELEKDFGDTLKEKGLALDSLVSDATSKLAAGGDVCALAPNIELPAANAGTGVTTEEVEDRVSNAATLSLSQTPKEILEVQGKKTTQSFFTNIQYRLNGRIIVPKATGTYSEIKAKYTVSLVKEKPVEVKQAAVPAEKEEVSIVANNTKVELKKEELKTKAAAVKTGEVFVKADPVKDVEPVVAENGKTVKVTTTSKSVTVESSSTTSTTTTGGGVTETSRTGDGTGKAAVFPKKRKTQSDNGLVRKPVTFVQRFVLKGSINEKIWDLRKHKVVDDITNIRLFREPFSIVYVTAFIEKSKADLSGSLVKVKDKVRLRYKRSEKRRRFMNIKPEFTGVKTLIGRRAGLLTLKDDVTNLNVAAATRVIVKYKFYSTIDPDYSG